MNHDLLRYYEQELRHLRDMGGEFARAFPKIAGRLGLEDNACADPYVERLLEGFSFLAARVQLKLDAEFPRFTDHLLELVYPHYLVPIPSMAIVQIAPQLDNPALAEGCTIARGTALRARLGNDGQTACEYRTAHALTLWPLELTDARYFAYTGQFAGAPLRGREALRAGLRLRLKTTAGLRFDGLALGRLPLHLRGADGIPARLLEQLLGSAAAVVVTPADTAEHIVLAPSIRHAGLEDDEALLPPGPRSFQGYRLLQEYFAFPQRFQFVELEHLDSALKRCHCSELDITVLFSDFDETLERMVGRAHFALHCTPAINLFPKRADRIHLSDRQVEHHLVPDRTRPRDFEVFQVLGITGYGTGANATQRFVPFYSLRAGQSGEHAPGYFQLRRSPRIPADARERRGSRGSYGGSEVFITLVDGAYAPYRSELRQLGVDTLCTNRDLPVAMPLGGATGDFSTDCGAPIAAISCVAGPSLPKPSRAAGATAWRLINHLALNYQSLLDPDALALRELLWLYCDDADPVGQRQAEALRSVQARHITRRLPLPGPVSYGRGLEITLTVDDEAFHSAGLVLLGAVLERLLARHANLNTFTETVLATTRRGAVFRWKARAGQCATL